MKQIPIVNPVIKDLNPLQEALQKARQAFIVVFVFAFCANLLQLITPLYSLQVLDRVLGSNNLHTLLMLSLIIGTIYFVYGMVQIARSFTLIKIGEWLDNSVSPLLFSNSVAAAAVKQTLGAGQVLRDFQTVKTFVTSTGLNTIFDAPWTIAYVIVLYMIHPYMGNIAVVGSIVIIIFAFINAIATTGILSEATEYSIKSLNQAEIATRNAEVIEAMGMMKNVSKHWHTFNKAALAKQSVASYRNGVISNFSRFIRNVISMLVTGMSAYVIVTTHHQAMTTGGMIASSILVGKALAPFDNFIELWKSITNTMKAYGRIGAALKDYSLRDDTMPIPHVEGRLEIKNIYYAHEAKNPLAFMLNPQYVIKDLSFNVAPGEILAIIGPSAAGKSTIAKLLVGVWKTLSGTIRLDGGEVQRWNRENFGEHVGYLPQGIELFSGTVKQNIARMAENFDPEQVIEAAKMAGAHDVILKLEEGYDSDIGIAGSKLSGGQKQRVGLARAFYGNPKLVILDEPNANLDEAGEKALSNALLAAKKKNITTIVISHRPSVLSVVDKILVLQNGSMAAYGTKDEVERKIEMLSGGIIHIN
jgi:PrtD family type I secretion system ABC transporter